MTRDDLTQATARLVAAGSCFDDATGEGLLPKYAALEAALHLREVRELVEGALDDAARVALQHGASYAELGRVLGVSRQAARQRYP
jgi:hypothetical protein